MLPENNQQITFQSMENQGNTIKDATFFYFDDLPFKLTKDRLQ